MKTWKHRTFSPHAFIGMAAILALAFTLAACDNGTGNGNENPRTAKYVSVDEDGDTWTLTIKEKTGRFSYSPQKGDTYVLEIDSETDGEIYKSKGQVQSNTNGKIKMKPENATETFEVTTNADGMTGVEGTITFDDGEYYNFNSPYILTPSSPPKGGSKNWTLVSNTTFGETNINAIAYGNGKFVAVGSGGKMAYSTNGINWTAVSNSTFENYTNPYIWSIAWGNGKFIAGGYGGKMAYSEDGITWTAVTNSAFGDNGIRGIAWGNNKYVAVGADKIAHSADGISWTAVAETKLSESINGIAWGNNKFIAVTGYSPGFTKTSAGASSPDGITWTSVEDVRNHMRDIVWGGNKFVAVASTRILYSTDGTTWGQAMLGTSFNTVAWGGNRFVTGGSLGIIHTSPDGATWTKMADNVLGISGTVGTINLGYEINDIAYGGNKFVAVGENGKMAYWQP